MERDTQDRIPLLAFIIPGIVLLVVIFNLVLGKVYWLPGRGQIPIPGNTLIIYSDRWRFWGTIMLKLGLAGGMFAWYGLANFSKTERAAIPLLVNSIFIAILGLIIFCVGMFR